MTTQLEASAIDQAELEAAAAKVAGDLAIAYHAVLVHLGERLGLWKALASVERTTSTELAERTGLAERNLRGWLAAQAAAGYLRHDGGSDSFTLSPELAMVLADEDSPAFGVAGFEVVGGVWASTDRLAQAYTTGEGLAWGEHDPRVFTGVDRFYRTFYRNSLLAEWLPAVDGLVARLEAGIRVVDVGCGLGSATIMMARAFPASRFVGVDNHEESVLQARAAAAEAGVADRVQFEVGDASSYAGTFDLVCFFDALHDLGDPVGALRHARSVLADGGQVFAVEPFAADSLEENLASNPAALTYLIGSTLLCVPHSMAEGGAALGAQAGPARLVGVLTEAGFGSSQVAAATAYNLVIEAHG